MAVKYFKDAFAVDGDLAAIPNDAQPSGSVSYAQGWGIDYSLDPTVNPNALLIPRTQSNQLYFDITSALQQYQQNGVPDFITTADNGGTPYPYSKYCLVRYDDGSGAKVYQSLIDNNTDLPTVGTSWSLQPLGATGNILYVGGTTTGTANVQAIASLSPNGFSLTNGSSFLCQPSVTNTSALTVNPNALGALTVKKAGATGLVDLVGGEFAIGNECLVSYNAAQSCLVLIAGFPLGTASALNLSQVLQSANNLSDIADLVTSQVNLKLAPLVTGNFKNLLIKNNTGTPNNIMDVTCDALALTNSVTSVPKLATAISQSPNITTSGAGGLDTGSVASNTWYALWIIQKADATTAALFSLSATAPTLPSGYIYKARVGWCRTDGSSHIRPIIQYGRVAQYTAPALQQMISGSSGSVTTPTWTAVAIGNYVPSTASKIRFVGFNTNDNAGNFIAAPNNSYGAYLSPSNPPPVSIDCTASVNINLPLEFILESSNIYYAGTGAGQGLAAFGWEDNL